MPTSSQVPPWTLLSSHGLVLLALTRCPTLLLREIAEQVGITPRAAQALVNDLVTEGYLERRREGRRSRYLVRGDRPLPHETTHDYQAVDLFRSLVAAPMVLPEEGTASTIVLGCSDFRYQEALRGLIAAEGLLARSEMFLWPGGSAALGGPKGGTIVAAMKEAVGARTPERIVLVAHQGCAVVGAHTRSGGDVLAVGRAVADRRAVGVGRIVKAFGIQPEMWFLTERGAQHVRTPAAQSA